MALSGSFNGTTNNEYIRPTITWSATQSISGNYSDVTATLKYSRTNSGYTTGGTWNGAIVINGTSKSGSKYINITQNSNTVAMSTTVRVYHNANGTKSITISASGGMSGTSLTSTTISSTVTLNTIPRATTPTFSASSVNMGSAVTITLNRASSSFTHTLSYAFGSLSGQTSGLSASSGVGTSATFTPPLTLANQIPNATSATCTVTCKTYNGSTLIGTKTATLTLKVPTSVVPTISAVSISEATAGLTAKFGVYVQNKSTLAVAITAYGDYGSTISKYETSIQFVKYRGASFTSNVITASGFVTVLTSVTDTRGRTAQLSRIINVVAYSPPEISSFSAWRIDTSGNADDDGNRIAMAMKFAISSVSGWNDHTYNFKYKKSTDVDFISFASGSASLSYDDTQYFTSAPEISLDYAYIIRIEISDYFETVFYEFPISTAFTIMDFRSTGKGMAIGKVSEKDVLEIAMDVDLTGKLLQEDRRTPTLLNSWVNYGADYEVASYWKDSVGVVHLAGLIKSGEVAAETVIFTLPEGYRPRSSEKFFCVSLNAICVINVYASGNVAIKTGANSGWLSLSGISFRTT